MPRIHAADHHDPFWDMDGKGARRTRLRRKFVRTAVYLVALMTLGVGVTRLPAVDPQFLIAGDGRPILAAALMTLLAASILIGLSWMRRAPH
ncbi:MAG: hypothetical protein E6I26_01670 [Chloroflexi bacterium]|nr:MAG: hypothetical protein E6I26_01670 [Chloroflexota bacterium]